jgi:uncharacterized protein YjeT (DUF2065 family)
MKWVLYAVSLMWITFGAFAILYTSETRNLAKSMLKDVDRKIFSVLPIVAGILLLCAASASRNSWVIRLFGIIAVIKGAFIFSNPNNLYDKFAAWYLESLSDQVLRLYGILSLILGTAVLSWIL